MRQNGKPLVRMPGHGRSMRFVLGTGETVRVRTCNDHVLIALADDPNPDKAKMNIEGTDWLLIVMPEVERSPGKVLAYLVPTQVAADEVRFCHREWLKSKPKTAGTNMTFNLWFGPSGKSGGYADKWQKYLLHGSTEAKQASLTDAVAPTGNIKDEVELARQRIAKAAGVSTAAVKIMVDFGG